MAEPPFIEYRPNNDDRALYRYLVEARDEKPRRLIFIVMRAWFTKKEKDWKTHKSIAIHSLAQFLAALEERTFGPTSHVPPWYAWLSFYRLNQPVEKLDEPDWAYNYFARDVLILALHEDRDGVAAALMEAYQQPAKDFIRHKFPASATAADLDFADVYQEAFLNLLDKPPAIDYPHSAQLFTYFRQILFRRCADKLRLARPENEELSDKIGAERNNSVAFTDHIISKHGLAERFGSDDAGEIVQRGMNKLDEKCRNLLLLRFYRNLKFREIASKTGFSTDSIGQRVKRCLSKMRNKVFGD